MAASRIWLLPDPDSPTMPKTSPRCTSKPTPSTARTQPVSSLNSMVRSRTASSGSALVGVEGIAQAIGDEVEAEERRGQEGARQQQDPDIGLELRRALVDQRAPARRRRLHAEAEEAEERFGDDDFQHQQARIDDHDVEGIGDDVAQD